MDELDDDVVSDCDSQDFYNKFNSLTFDTTSQPTKDFDFSKSHFQSDTSEKDVVESLDAEDDAITELTQRKAVFFLNIHPLLMLSDIHRRSYPSKRCRGLSIGRYNAESRHIKFILSSSEVMTDQDKREVLYTLSAGLLISITRSSRQGGSDFYYWMFNFARCPVQQNCSATIRRTDVVDFFGTKFFNYNDLVFKIPGCLGCIPRSSCMFSRPSVQLSDSSVQAATSSSPNASRYAVLKKIEENYRRILDMNVLLCQLPKDKHEEMVRTHLIGAITDAIHFDMLHDKDNNWLPKFLTVEKGRKLVCILAMFLNEALRIQVIFLILQSLQQQTLTDLQFMAILFHNRLADLFFMALRAERFEALERVFTMATRCQRPLLHTYVGLAVVAAIMSSFSVIPVLAYPQIQLTLLALQQLTQSAANIGALPAPLVSQCKNRIVSIVAICRRIKSDLVHQESGPLINELLSSFS